MANRERGIRIAGNWKMNLGQSDVLAYFSQLESEFLMNRPPLAQTKGAVQISLAPHFLALSTAIDCAIPLNDNCPIEILAQNAHWEKAGAYTGEISADFLKDHRVAGALIGHSERRQYFGETNETATKRAVALLQKQMRVIFCIGETRAEREAGKTFDVLQAQISLLFSETNRNLCEDSIANGKLELAYEPVWAIGTGLTATPQQAEEVHHYLRESISRLIGKGSGNRLKILYGGSVTPENFKELLLQPNIDGGLVGGASLKPVGFYKLVALAVSTLLQGTGN